MATFNYPYNRMINNSLINDYKMNAQYDSPDDIAGLTRRFGGNRARSSESNYISIPKDKEYVQAGDIGRAPNLNAEEIIKMNKMKKPYEYYQGTGKMNKYGGKINKKKVISTALDIAPTVAGLLPLLAGPEGAAASPFVGFAANKAREFIRHKTGYGKVQRLAKSAVSNTLDILPMAMGFYLSKNVPDNEKALMSAMTTSQLKNAREKLRELTGLGFHPIHAKIYKHILKHKSLRGKGISFNDVKKSIVPILKKSGPILTDIILPNAFEQAGQYIGLPKGTGRIIGNIARSVIREKAGFGVHKKHKKRQEELKIEPRNVDKYVAKYKGGKMQKRNEMIKEIMHKKKMSLPEASAYIKRKNLM